MNHASHRRKRGDDEDLVARFRIGDAVQFMQRFERDAHGRAVGADQAAIEIERVYRRLNGIANLQRPRRPIGDDARQARPIELDAHDIGVRRARQFGAANGVGCLALESGKINVRFRVEHKPQRIGPIEHRSRRGRREVEGQFQVLVIALKLDRNFSPGLAGFFRMWLRRLRGSGRFDCRRRRLRGRLRLGRTRNRSRLCGMTGLSRRRRTLDRSDARLGGEWRCRCGGHLCGRRCGCRHCLRRHRHPRSGRRCVGRRHRRRDSH